MLKYTFLKSLLVYKMTIYCNMPIVFKRISSPIEVLNKLTRLVKAKWKAKEFALGSLLEVRKTSANIYRYHSSSLFSRLTNLDIAKL